MISFLSTQHQAVEQVNHYKELMEPNIPYQFTISLPEEMRGENAFRYFHKCRDRYAEALGYSKPFAKVELKYLYGVNIPYDENFKPPKRAGQFVEIYGVMVFQISTNKYTKKEMTALIMGLKKSCYENGIDISDLEIPEA